METYIIYFRAKHGRAFGPNYWGSYKHTKAFDMAHAQQKLKRIQTAYFAKHGFNGEFRVDLVKGEQLRYALLGLKGWRRR